MVRQIIEAVAKAPPLLRIPAGIVLPIFGLPVFLIMIIVFLVGALLVFVLSIPAWIMEGVLQGDATTEEELNLKRIVPFNVVWKKWAR